MHTTISIGLDYSPLGSSVHGIFQARMLEWVVISYSRKSSQARDQTHISRISYIGGIFFTTVPPGKPGITIDTFKHTQQIHGALEKHLFQSMLKDQFEEVTIFTQLNLFKRAMEITVFSFQ